MNSEFLVAISYPLLAFLGLVVLHGFSIRIKIKQKQQFSGQVLLVKVNFVINLLIISLYSILNRDIDYFYSSLLYIIIVYNAFSYMYFHFFNMSETARRIKLLIMIHQGEIKQLNEIQDKYKKNFMVQNRLKRLTSMGQVECLEGKYHLRKRLLLNAALLISFWKKLLKLNK